MKRIRVKSSVKKRVWKRDDFKCCLNISEDCIKELDINNATVDHIISSSNGGTNNIDNLQTACRPCNFKKSLTEQTKVKIYGRKK